MWGLEQPFGLFLFGAAGVEGKSCGLQFNVLSKGRLVCLGDVNMGAKSCPRAATKS